MKSLEKVGFKTKTEPLSAWYDDYGLGVEDADDEDEDDDMSDEEDALMDDGSGSDEDMDD